LAIRRMNSKVGNSGKVRGHQQQQAFVERITDLEAAVAQELARSKAEAATSAAYLAGAYTRPLFGST